MKIMFRRKKRLSITINKKVLNYYLKIPDLESFIWQFKEIFADNIYQFKCDTNTPIIYDIGANIGTSILYFKKIYPDSKIIAFEADEEIYKILIQNLSYNNIPNIITYNKAVWTNNKSMDFYFDNADGGTLYNPKIGRRSRKVQCIRLKDILDKEDKIDFLKMDIEGAEYDVCVDSKELLYKIQNIFIEYHSWNNNTQKLSEILSILEYHKFRYYIQTINKRVSPLINKNNNDNMDMQLNIFAYKS